MWSELLCSTTVVAHFLAKIAVVLLVLTGYAAVCWGIIQSPNAVVFAAAIALGLSVLNSAAIFALWVFYLARQFSTHSVKVLDLKKTAATKTPVVSDKFEVDPVDDSEKEIKNWADSVTAQMFHRTKEKLNDSLT